VARRATQIKAARAQGGNVLVVDAGNALIGELGNTSEPAERTKGVTSVEALNRLGYDAVALGPRDLLLGHDELLKRLGEARGYSFLSANLYDKATGKLAAQPYLIKEIGGHRVALIGITGAVPEETEECEAVAALVAAVQSKADVVVLLSNAGLEANKVIAGQVQGIDLIVSGGQGSLTEPLQMPSGTLIVHADQSSSGHAGRVLGDLLVSFDLTGKLTAHSWKAVTLDPNIPDDQAMAAWVAEVRQQK
jgi:2',3'-cyclic-nucleotide 2'-phosphodiesterase (5'-nucleotidase family)